MNRSTENPKKVKPRHLWLGAALLILVIGCIAGLGLVITTLGSYPSLIAEAYNDPLQRVDIPGEADLELSRKGAYAIYYERQNGSSTLEERPPTLDCHLTSKMTGKDVPLVPDYVPSNQYSTKDGDQVGVLIYSTTVEYPGYHTLSCGYPDGGENPELVIAIGPNYFFEFLRVAWKLRWAILGVVCIPCISIMLGFGVVMFMVVKKRNNQTNQEKPNNGISFTR